MWNVIWNALGSNQILNHTFKISNEQTGHKDTLLIQQCWITIEKPRFHWKWQLIALQTMKIPHIKFSKYTIIGSNKNWIFALTTRMVCKITNFGIVVGDLLQYKIVSDSLLFEFIEQFWACYYIYIFYIVRKD